MIFRRVIVSCFLLSFCAELLIAQGVSVNGRLKVVRSDNKSAGASGVVVWLSRVESVSEEAPHSRPRFRLIQKDKRFDPRLMVVPVGSAVEFPNLDPWFHNVFSLFDGKRFDLGLYEAGTTRTVHFDKAGVSYIFCNIHPEMSALVVAVPTSHYGISDTKGAVSIPNVPTGRYVVHFWQENALPNDLNKLTRQLEVSESTSSFGLVEVREHTSSSLPHKDKYGQDYQDPSPSSPVYTR